jgi:hypothetical protein
MLWWRAVVSHARWNMGVEPSPDLVEQCARSLELRGEEEGLSVYRAEGLDQAAKIAHYFALTLTLKSPDNQDYILIPDSSLQAASIGLPVHVPDPNSHSFLRDLHHEVFGLTLERSRNLAAAILADPGRHACRAKRAEIEAAAKDYLKSDHELRDCLTTKWAVRLGV